MIIAAIVAGGSGTRMGGEMPKQFMSLCGKPILIHTTENFLHHPAVDAVIIGINPDWYEYTKKLLSDFLPDAPVCITKGGSNRNETIVNIIHYAQTVLSCSENDIILSHDAVRPFVTERMINDSIEALEQYPICTAAVAETDTVAISVSGQTADSFPDRSTVYRIQTPQTFRIGTFRQVYDTLSDSEKAAATDVCSLFSQKHLAVGLIRGDYNNIKLTYPGDMQNAESILLNNK